ncbi:hypothetical protein BDZ94DRAFT_1366456 [Collybia nuda]|uniref:KOW domain-containing protein n=1 Tax=Collybia nuda TaxID=64659 RepID=A0A9P6C7T2_9AGAR|nr:hypothetical protein BDZ94DRAFT_1366456 [Collybia nuda]
MHELRKTGRYGKFVLRSGPNIGFEESSAYHAHGCLVNNSQLRESICAVIGRSSIPGSIVVEAENIGSVQALANRLSHVINNKISLVPHERYGSCLTENKSFAPISPGWIRLDFSIYKGDLAFVHSVNHRTLALHVILVPRINYSSTRRNQKCLPRPPRALFDLEAVKLTFGNHSVKICSDHVEFNGNSYHEQFLTLRCGDNVKVYGSQLRGHIGIVNSIVDENVNISFDDLPDGLDLKLYDVRKHFEVGDYVVVCLGPHFGYSGWLVRVDGSIGYILDNVSSEEITVSLRSLDFWSPLYDSEKVPSLKNNSHRQKSYTNRLVGCHVRVVGNNVFKNYVGIIKDVANNGFASVELEATMRMERVSVNQLVLTDDPSMVPVAQPHLFPNDSSGRIPTSRDCESQIPPPTPLPPPLAGFVSPAWDPSSRTPNRENINNSWIYSTSLQGKRIRVILKGTKPVLRDPGFHYGAYEGRPGLFTGTDMRNNASITVSVHETLSVPSRYVHPMVPDLKGHHVIAIKGNLVGKEYKIVSITYPSCVMKPKTSKSRKDFLDYDVENLAILA